MKLFAYDIISFDLNETPFLPPDGGKRYSHLRWVAYADGGAVGVLNVSDESIISTHRSALSIDYIYVLPAYRRKGLATALYRQALADLGREALPVSPPLSPAGMALAKDIGAIVLVSGPGWSDTTAEFAGTDALEMAAAQAEQLLH